MRRYPVDDLAPDSLQSAISSCSRCSRSFAADGFKQCPACRAKVLEKVLRYQQTKKGRATWRRYRQTEKGRATHRATQRRYQQTEKGRATQRRADIRRSGTEKRIASLKPARRRFNNKQIAKNRMYWRSRTYGVDLFQKLTGFQIPKGWLDARHQ